MSSNTGLAAEREASVPEARMVRVPFEARIVPPETGASTSETSSLPASLRRRWISGEYSGGPVLQSMITAPFSSPLMAACGPSKRHEWICAAVATINTMKWASFTVSLGELEVEALGPRARNRSSVGE